MTKDGSRLKGDLESLSQRIQDIKMRLHESGTRTKNLQATIHASKPAESARHKRKLAS